MSKIKKEKNKPNSIIWFIYVSFCKLFVKIKNHTKIDRSIFKSRNKKEGCIILFNHASKYDHFFTSATLGYNPTSYVISSHFYYNRLLKFFLNKVKAIPKEQFKADISTIKKIKRALQNNVPVAIAPAGQITMHGEQLIIDKTIVKLLKMCNVDVYAIQIHGAYFAYPKWRKYARKVKISTNFVKVFSKEELNNLSDEELYYKTCKSIDVNDRLEQTTYRYKLKAPALAEGLETILYKCPKCGMKETLTTKKDMIYCTNCQNAALMSNNGSFEGIGNDYVIMKNEAVWYSYQKSCLLKDIKNNELHIEGRFNLFTNVNQKYLLEKVGEGKIVLTNNEFYYEGLINGYEVRKNFKLESLSQLPFEPNHHFDVPDDEGHFECRPLDNEAPSKVVEFVQAIETLYLYRRGL